MAAFLSRAFKYADGAGSNLFIDDDGHLFENAIDKLGTAKVTLGCNPPDNTKFCPDDFVTRGQMAAFLARALGLSPIYPPPPTSSTTTPSTTSTTLPALETYHSICSDQNASSTWVCYESTLPNDRGTPVSGGFKWNCSDQNASSTWVCYESTLPNDRGTPVTGGANWWCQEPGISSNPWICSGEFASFWLLGPPPLMLAGA